MQFVGDYELRRDVDFLSSSVNDLQNFKSSVAETTYFIEPNCVVVVLNDDNSFRPSFLDFNSYQSDITGTDFFDGELTVYKSVNGQWTQIKETSGHLISITPEMEKGLEAYRGVLKNENGATLDYQTVYVISDVNNVPLVFLDNEAQLIPCEPNGDVTETMEMTVRFYGYKGSTQMPVSLDINKLRGSLNYGISVSEYVEGTASNAGLLRLTVPKGDDLNGIKSSVIELELTVEDTSFVRGFSWAKIFKGSDGKDAVQPQLAIKYADSENPTVMYDDPVTDGVVHQYMGFKWWTDTKPTTVDDFKPFNLFIGENGENGIAGENSYVHIAYAKDRNGEKYDFSTTDPTGRDYIGFYTDNVQKDSTDWHDYTWSAMSGTRIGILYSNSANPTSFSETSESDMSEYGQYKYIGYCYYTDEAELNDITNWKFVQYVPDEGINGESSYIHVAYSNSEDGNPCVVGSTDGANYDYIGICTNNSPYDPTDYWVYDWSLIKGEKGEKGEDATISDDDIIGALGSVDLDASTFDGQTPDAFVSANLDQQSILVSVGTDIGKITATRISNIVIVDVHRVRGTMGTNTTGTGTHWNVKTDGDVVLKEEFRPTNYKYLSSIRGELMSIDTEGHLRISSATTPSGTRYELYGTFVYVVSERETTSMSYQGSSITTGDYIYATLKDSKGSPLADKPVNFVLNGVTYAKKTNSSGVAEQQVNLAAGSCKWSVKFQGDDQYLPSSCDNIRLSIDKRSDVVPTLTAISNGLRGHVDKEKTHDEATLQLMRANDDVQVAMGLTKEGDYDFTNIPSGTYYVQFVENKWCNKARSTTQSYVKGTQQYTVTKTPQNVINSSQSNTITGNSVQPYNSSTVSASNVSAGSDDKNIRCYINGAGNSIHVRPSDIEFNAFKFPAINGATNVSITVRVQLGLVGADGSSISAASGLSPVAILWDRDAKYEYGRASITMPVNNFGIFETTINIANNIGLINSDNLSLMIRCGGNNTSYSSASYNRCILAIDYVGLILSYTK